MNAKLSQQMTFLGLAAMAFYAVMLATGVLSIEVMPQFVVSALIFLSSGRLMRPTVREENEEDEQPKRPKVEPNWPWLTQLLNWSMTLIVLGIMALWLMKPVGVSFIDSMQQAPAHDPYYADAIP